VLPKLTLTLSGDQSLYDYENPTRQTRAFTGQSILTYVFSPNLLADASGSIRVLEDTAVPTQRTTLAGLRVRWWLRDLEVNPTLQFFSQQQGGAQTDEWRAVLYTIRRF